MNTFHWSHTFIDLSWVVEASARGNKVLSHVAGALIGTPGAPTKTPGVPGSVQQNFQNFYRNFQRYKKSLIIGLYVIKILLTWGPLFPVLFIRNFKDMNETLSFLVETEENLDRNSRNSDRSFRQFLPEFPKFL